MVSDMLSAERRCGKRCWDSNKKDAKGISLGGLVSFLRERHVIFLLSAEPKTGSPGVPQKPAAWLDFIEIFVDVLLFFCYTVQ